jgi:catechol 2,3-dioxygenase-like lactoylglutathione lyase family enzyme
MNIQSLDHVVLTVRNMAETIDFYSRVLGMRHIVFDGGFNALHFGKQKINLHPFRAEYLPHADIPAPGTADFCFVAEGTIGEAVAELASLELLIEVGPIAQTGAKGQMQSVYIRDPDRNLIEIACYDL